MFLVKTNNSQTPLGSSNGTQEQQWEDFPIYVPAKLNSEVSTIRPIVAYRAHMEPISDLKFTKEVIITSCWGGFSKFWLRPEHSETFRDLRQGQSDEKKPDTVEK